MIKNVLNSHWFPCSAFIQSSSIPGEHVLMFHCVSFAAVLGDIRLDLRDRVSTVTL